MPQRKRDSGSRRASFHLEPARFGGMVGGLGEVRSMAFILLTSPPPAWSESALASGRTPARNRPRGG
jgi:hypothetical protein